MGGTIVGIILIFIGLSAVTGIHFFNFIFAIVLIVIGIRMSRTVRRAVHGDGRTIKRCHRKLR